MYWKDEYWKNAKTTSNCHNGRNKEKTQTTEKKDQWGWRGFEDNGNMKSAHSGKRRKGIEEKCIESNGPQQTSK